VGILSLAKLSNYFMYSFLPSILGSVYDALTNFALSNGFWANFDLIYGLDYDKVKADNFQKQWQNRDFSQLPPIEVVSSFSLGNARGAYSAETDTIYLADGFLATATRPTIEAVILEEYGHYIDVRVNRSDSPGDEGEIFANLVLGKSLSPTELARLQSENDHAVVNIGGREIAIEMSLGTTGYIQFGTSVEDYANGISTDSSGNLYVTGNTQGSFPGYSNSGNGDAFVAKYNTLGNQLWVRQFGTPGLDSASGISVDGSGNLYVTGSTWDSFPGYSNSGRQDAFVAKYNTLGNQLWVRQFGTSNDDFASRISVDSSGNLYVTGYTWGSFPGYTISGQQDAFVAKYNTLGNQLWVRQFGTSNYDFASGISTDSSGNLYVIGSTDGSFPGYSNSGRNDVFVAKYDSGGNQLWMRQFGTSSNDEALGIGTDSSGNLYVTGGTSGSFPGYNNSGNGDAFVAKYDALGNQLWVRQFGTPSSDFASGISVDSSGNLYVTGYTSGSFPGYSNFGNGDSFVAKYNTLGNQLWVRQFGTSNRDEASGISTDSSGNLYFTGNTSGSLPGNSNSGSHDAFVVGLDANGNLLSAPILTISDVSVTEGDSGTRSAVFTVTRTGAATAPITVTYATADGTATAGSDYIATGGALAFATNETTKTFTVPILGDRIFESDETFFVNLTNVTNATLAVNRGSGVIINDDTSVTLSVSPSSVTEDGTTNLVYTFTRAGVLTNALTVNYSVGGTATFNTDYTVTGTASFTITTTTGTLTFAPGSGSATVTVDPTSDTLMEADETVILTLAEGTGHILGTTAPVTGTITNDDTSITLAVSPVSVTEDGTTNLVYTFTRTGVLSNSRTVNYTVSGTATNGTDYATIPTSVTFAAGSATATVTVDPTADTTVEADETVILTLATGTGYTIGTTAPVTGTITNDDSYPLNINTFPYWNGGGTSSLGDSTGTTDLGFGQSFIAGNRFARIELKASSFSRHSSPDDLDIRPLLVNLDTNRIIEIGEPVTIPRTEFGGYQSVFFTNQSPMTIGGNYAILLSAIGLADSQPSYGSLGTVIGRYYDGGSFLMARLGNGAIGDSISNVYADPDREAAFNLDFFLTRVSLALSSLTVSEDGTPNLVYTFTRAGILSNSLTVNYNIGGTATLNNDYTQTGAATFTTTTGTVTFAPGSTTATVTIDPTSDTLVEADETVILTLAAGTSYTVGATTPVTGTLLNDDTSVTLAVSPASVSEDGTPNLVYTFTRAGVLSNTLTVNYTIAGTATNGTDYATIPTSVTFTPGSATATVTVNPTGDTTQESDETVALTLASGTGYTVGTTTAVTGTIANDDSNSAPSDLMFTPNQMTYNAGETLTLTNAWVKDLNGSSDLARVDMWVQKPNGEWIDISDVTTFTPWTGGNEWGGFNYSLALSNYEAGNYTLWGQARDRSGGTSGAITKTFTVFNNSINFAPSDLQFNLDKASYQVGDTLTLIGAWVKDPNGSNDLSRVDLWLKPASGDWIDVSDATTFTPWSGGGEWGSFNYSLNLSRYRPDNYTLWAQAIDANGATSGAITKTFTVFNNAINFAPSDLQFNLDKASYQVGDTLTLTNAWVKDPNGSNDLSRVDLWLKPASGDWIDVSDATTFTPWSGDGEWGSFNYSLNLSRYRPDNYTLWAQASDRERGTSNVVTKTFSLLNSAPTDLMFNPNKTIYTTADTLTLVGAWVKDLNGSNDLVRVDIWIKPANGNWINLSDATTFTPWSGGAEWGSFNYSLSLGSYTPGSYTLWGQAIDANGALSNEVSRSIEIITGRVI
jgi:Calx-beta domain/Beta-propeller repeat